MASAVHFFICGVAPMDCMNVFCIYQKDDRCLLDHISLDDMGCCQECIYPDLSPQTLEHEKEKSRNRYTADDFPLTHRQDGFSDS